MADRHPGVAMLPEGAARWAFGFGAACYAAGLRPPDHWGCARDDGSVSASWYAAAPGRATKHDLVAHVSYSADDNLCLCLNDRGRDDSAIHSFMVGRHYDEDFSEWREGPPLAEALAHVKRFFETGLYRPETEAALAAKAAEAAKEEGS